MCTCINVYMYTYTILYTPLFSKAEESEGWMQHTQVNPDPSAAPDILYYMYIYVYIYMYIYI